MRKRLTKSPNNVVFTGTLAGIAEWLGIDPTIVRVMYVVASFIFIGSPIVLYIVLAVLIPSGRNRGNNNYGHQNPYNRNTHNPNPYANGQKQRKQAEKVNDDDWSDF
ncbi:PspC family transcriptional regulator [Enterococcus ureilyticus]|uniref:PspC family transcriptional regulator n=1 Tax=Enterococcus ureilyticus TaxID=1131292 RepID=A0A1E5HH99_9ENTE|nr:PspC domain-containing protein [Enterococcus ureilyticus]MBM7689719.1 phage shock protein PspC (stress-responsive transcriptional regulator) [Enterococcus ureilyticus]MBO0445765.1 PspC domain-containing protein [Enterococcus ureilyticus]OEG24010.1 PspC family transcriptional regulator [Enterococcus ureilyticus]